MLELVTDEPEAVDGLEMVAGRGLSIARPTRGGERTPERARGRPRRGERRRDVEQRREDEASGAPAAYNACAAARSSSKSGTCAVSYRHAPRIVPCRSTTKAVRSATSLSPLWSCAMSSAWTASPFQSERSGTSRSSASRHARCDQGLSREIAYGVTPAASNSALLSRRSVSSSVQVLDQSKR